MRTSFKTAVLAAVAILAPEQVVKAAATKDSCRALVMSGGGSNGAWEVGVLYGLINNGITSDYEYDVVTGVSIGSINAFFMALWPLGQEKEMIQTLSDIWNTNTSATFFKNWPLSPAQGLMNK